jgi:hypothetical protein
VTKTTSPANSEDGTIGSVELLFCTMVMLSLAVFRAASQSSTLPTMPTNESFRGSTGVSSNPITFFTSKIRRTESSIRDTSICPDCTSDNVDSKKELSNGTILISMVVSDRDCNTASDSDAAVI